MQKILYKTLAGIGITGFFVLLYYSPVIDQNIAFLPFNSASSKFYGEVHLWSWIIYYLVPVLTTLFISVPLVILGLSIKTSGLKQYRKSMLTILVALALGPGLVVNVALKNHWGRARPYQVLRDHKVFSPVWQPHFNAHADNSFCSGHAAIGFFCGVPFWALRRKKIAYLVSLGAGGIIGLVRILQGGHYFSDVIFAGVFVWICAYIATYIINMVASPQVSQVN